jgi:purine-binding chemotaxis protein CheW
LVVFSLHAEEYALPISSVQEIIRFSEPRAVASSDPVVCGVISLRGRIVPVLDLALRLGLDPIQGASEAKIVIAETGEDVTGFVVDDVTEVLTVEAEQIDEAPASITSGCITGVAKIEDRLVVVLEPSALTAGAVSGIEAAERPLHAVA